MSVVPRTFAGGFGFGHPALFRGLTSLFRRDLYRLIFLIPLLALCSPLSFLRTSKPTESICFFALLCPELMTLFPARQFPVIARACVFPFHNLSDGRLWRHSHCSIEPCRYETHFAGLVTPGPMAVTPHQLATAAMTPRFIPIACSTGT